MILVLLGTQPHQFNRMAKQVIELIDEQQLLEKYGISQILVQAGATSFESRPMLHVVPYLDRKAYEEALNSAKIVITHGGAGSMFDALRRGKTVIAMPRLVDLGEHVDSHQVELVDKLQSEHLIISEPTLVDSMKMFDVSLEPYVDERSQALHKIEKIINKI